MNLFSARQFNPLSPLVPFDVRERLLDPVQRGLRQPALLGGWAKFPFLLPICFGFVVAFFFLLLVT